MTGKIKVTVVGGVYAESVRSPRSYELYGSGGRAAATLSLLKSCVALVTALDEEKRKLFEPMAASFGFDLKVTEISTTTEFIYNHPLGPPRTRPLRSEILQPGALQAEDENVLVFGMLEGEPKVNARRAVYDPQSPLSPKWFEDTGSTADEVTYVLNRREGYLLTGESDSDKIVRAVLARKNVKACVLKLGPRGALVGNSSGELLYVPCYRTERVWPVGSGDIFAAVLSWGLFVKGVPLVQAAEAASRAVALYSNSTAIPSRPELLLGEKVFPFPAVNPKGRPDPQVYLAGPFFTLQDRWLIEETRDVLHGFGIRVFSPVHDVGEGEAEIVAPQDLKGVAESSVVLALLEGLDPGTLFEVGFARALGIPVIAYVGEVSPTHLKMIGGSQCTLEKDYTTALYRTAWDVLEL